MLQWDPSKRPTAEDILSSDYFTDPVSTPTSEEQKRET
jgi:serine/threonine protein kinase